MTKRESPKLQSIRIKLCGTLKYHAVTSTRQHQASHYKCQTSIKHLSHRSSFQSLSIHPSNPAIHYPIHLLTPTMGEDRGDERTWPGLGLPQQLHALHGMAWHWQACRCSARMRTRPEATGMTRGHSSLPWFALWVYIFCLWHSSVGLHMPTAPLLYYYH